MVIFCLVSVPVGIEVSGMILAKSSLSLKGPAYVTQKAKQSAYGNDFLFIEFIKQYLLSEKISVVYIPPYRLPWRHTGDPGIMNSLLYPATTTSNYSLTPYIIISSEADGSVYHLWPDFIVAADKIIIYDWSTGQGRVYSGRDWDPAEWQDQKPWGLIIRKQI